MPKHFALSKITPTFAAVIGKRFEKSVSNKSVTSDLTYIGVWCNGNTTDSGPVILGSSPSTPTPYSNERLK